MAITASDVKQLREMTGAGMMACKNALKESDGDMEKAVDFLRQKGLAAAQKKQTRTAAEGVVATFVEGNLGVVVEVNCETDFVSKGDDFQSFAKAIASHIVSNKPSDIAELLNQKFNGTDRTVAETATELTLKCGEKIDLRRFETVQLAGSGVVGNYNHGGKIGVLVEINATESNDAVQELAKDLAMHVAAADPKFLNAGDIDEDFKAREAAIYKAQLEEQGKPADMIDKIIKGKLNKLASEVCLLNQKFVKDADTTVEKLIASVNKEITITSFVKLNLGEGIEKKEDNLAEEVAKMTGKQ
jgi:elongation factor Ts